MILTKIRYRTPRLAAHQKCTSSGSALFWGQGLFGCYMDINLQLVIDVAQGREKTRSSEAGVATSSAGTRRQKVGAACSGALPERSWATDPNITSEKKWHREKNFLEINQKWSSQIKANCCLYCNLKVWQNKGHFCLLFDLTSSEYDLWCGVIFSCTFSAEGRETCVSQLPFFPVL